METSKTNLFHVTLEQSKPLKSVKQETKTVFRDKLSNQMENVSNFEQQMKSNTSKKKTTESHPTNRQESLKKSMKLEGRETLEEETSELKSLSVNTVLNNTVKEIFSTQENRVFDRMETQDVLITGLLESEKITEEKEMVTPLFGELLPLISDSKTLIDESKLPNDESSLLIDELKPLIDESKLPNDESSLLIDETKPLIDELKLPNDESSLLIDETKPLTDELKSLIDESMSSVDKINPSTESDSLKEQLFSILSQEESNVVLGGVQERETEYKILKNESFITDSFSGQRVAFVTEEEREGLFIPMTMVEELNDHSTVLKTLEYDFEDLKNQKLEFIETVETPVKFSSKMREVVSDSKEILFSSFLEKSQNTQDSQNTTDDTQDVFSSLSKQDSPVFFEEESQASNTESHRDLKSEKMFLHSMNRAVVGNPVKTFEEVVTSKLDVQIDSGKAMLEDIRYQVIQSKRQMKIQLKPKSLGEMTLDLQVFKGGIVAKFFVENEKAKLLIEQNLPQLRDTFKESGTEIKTVEVFVGNGADFHMNQQNMAHSQQSKQQMHYNRNNRNYNEFLNMDSAEDGREEAMNLTEGFDVLV